MVTNWRNSVGERKGKGRMEVQYSMMLCSNLTNISVQHYNTVKERVTKYLFRVSIADQLNTKSYFSTLAMELKKSTSCPFHSCVR